MNRRDAIKMAAAVGAGVATLCGDRHSFLAGEVSMSSTSARGPRVLAEFVTGSISAPGLAEAVEYGVQSGNALRPVYVYDPPTRLSATTRARSKSNSYACLGPSSESIGRMAARSRIASRIERRCGPAARPHES